LRAWHQGGQIVADEKGLKRNFIIKEQNPVFCATGPVVSMKVVAQNTHSVLVTLQVLLKLIELWSQLPNLLNSVARMIQVLYVEVRVHATIIWESDWDPQILPE
jgi:hypothetical protein